MTIRAVLQAPDARLRQVCAPVTVFDGQLAAIAADLNETRRSHRGYGLAAPQIGEPLRVVSLNPGQSIGYKLMVNPAIVKHGNNKSFGDEGCLSIDQGERRYRIKRWDTITVWFQTENGELREVVARGFAARVVQHEIDHLDGKMIDSDRVGR